MPLELTKLNTSAELDPSSVESTGAKLSREAYLLLGGLVEGTADSAADGMSAEKWTRTAASFALAAGLTLAMKRPGLIGTLGRGAGTMGALNFAVDLANPRRLNALGDAFGDTWNSGKNLQSNYEVVKKELGTIGFDTMLGVGGGMAGSALAWRFGVKPLAAEIIKQPAEPAKLAGEKSILAASELSTLEPLNVFSRSKEPLGRALSNFAHTPFVLDGVKYASVEALYVGLKYLDAAKRAEIAPLYGSYAKSAGNKAPAITETSYMGEKIKLGSVEHHALIERAIRAKIEQNPDIMHALSQTGERSIVHDTGRLSTRKSNLPDQVFADMIGRIRSDIIAKGQIPPASFNPASLAAIEVNGGKSSLVGPAIKDTVTGAEKITISGGTQGEIPLTTVSDALRSINNPKLVEFHNLKDYATAFDGFDRKVSKVLGGGTDSVVLRMQDGSVLKITTRELPADLGQRVFDLPVLEQGSRTVGGRQVNYFVQPFAEKAKAADLHAIGESVKASGYYFDEPFLNQVGRYNGRPWLLDPFAVTKSKY